jgi:Bacteriophage head to tail connecting protein
MADDTTNKMHLACLEGLKQERTYYESLWSDYDQYIVPGRLRLKERANKGTGKYGSIIDETALHAYRTFRSGMQSGQSSPSRPWFKLGTMDPKFKDLDSVKQYTFESESRMRQVMAGSNLYNVLHNGYGDIGQFGQMAALLIEDDISVIRALPILHGQFWLGQNHRGRVDTLYRIVQMTVKQLVGRFVSKPDGSMDWSYTSPNIKTLYDSGNVNTWVKVWHAIAPRSDCEYGKMDKRNKPFLSNYWEDGAMGNKMLEESGFSYNPILAPRWETMGEDVYGSHHPGDISLPGIKMLQAEQRDKGIAIKKMYDPALQAPTSLKNNRSSTFPGSITYVDSVGQQQAIRPLHEVNLNIAHLTEDIREVQQRIETSWYSNLFMAISQMEGIQPKNVYELTQRKEEQLLQLGPVVDRQQNELLNPIVDITFRVMAEKGMLPEAPRELGGEPLKIEHVSIFAQAQRAVATGAIERTMSYVGSIAGINPAALDKIDFDQSIDEYADMIGAPPTMIRSDEAVAKDRQARQAAQQQAQQADMAAKVAPAMQQGADAARLLAETSAMQNGTKTSDLLSRLGIAG